MTRGILAILAAWPVLGSAAMRYTNVSMTWPKPHVAYDAIQNDQIVSSDGTEFEEEYTWARWHYDSPCEHIPIPSNITRVPFPVAGGRVQFSVTSPVWSDPSEIDRNQTGEYWINIMFGQIGGYDPNKDKHSGPRGPLARHSIEGDNFYLGHFCTSEPDIYEFSTYSGSDVIKGYALDGLDATLGVRIQYRAPDTPGSFGHLNGIETLLTQCAYIRFTSKPSGPENPCPSRVLALKAYGESGPARMAMGLGISAGLAVVLIIVGLWWRRRNIKKRRKAEWPQGPEGPELPSYPDATRPAVVALERSSGMRVSVVEEANLASNTVRPEDAADDAPPAYSEQPPQYRR